MSEIKVQSLNADSNAQSVALSQRLASAAFVGLLGTFLLLGIGFANADVVHNAAHDSRHANSFPCH